MAWSSISTEPISKHATAYSRSSNILNHECFTHTHIFHSAAPQIRTFQRGGLRSPCSVSDQRLTICQGAEWPESAIQQNNMINVQPSVTLTCWPLKSNHLIVESKCSWDFMFTRLDGQFENITSSAGAWIYITENYYLWSLTALSACPPSPSFVFCFTKSLRQLAC